MALQTLGRKELLNVAVKIDRKRGRTHSDCQQAGEDGEVPTHRRNKGGRSKAGTLSISHQERSWDTENREDTAREASSHRVFRVIRVPMSLLLFELSAHCREHLADHRDGGRA